MIKRIDLFMPPEGKSRYHVLPHFTTKLGEALTRAGVQCRILTSERNNPKPFLEALYNDPPDCTLSFNGLLPDDQGRFFCDFVKIPHVAFLVDSPTQYLVLANSPYTIITCPDRFACEFFKGLKCQNVLFIPHAIEKDLTPPKPHEPRPNDVTMMSSCIDYEAIGESWVSQYPKGVRDAMYEAIEITLSDQETSCIQAFVQTMDQHMSSSRITPGLLNYPDVIDQIELYTKGRDRVELVRAIKDAQIHLFGQPVDLWKKYLKNKVNVTYHEPVSFENAFDIMKKSKIVLNSCAWLKDGTHERILSGLACGALVLTNENIYMREHFKNDQQIAFFQLGQWSKVNQQINDYLSHPAKIEKIASQGRDIVMKEHIWDQRAKILLKELPPILNNISIDK